jgi:hypothetical protein
MRPIVTRAGNEEMGYLPEQSMRNWILPAGEGEGKDAGKNRQFMRLSRRKNCVLRYFSPACSMT